MPRDIETSGASSQPTRVAVIGCGAATRLYGAPALAQLERQGVLRVAALFDPDSNSVETVRSLLMSARPAQSLEAALEVAKLAIIASPSALHASQSVLALQRGRHVLCEKPMALTRDEADTVMAAAEASGRVLAIGLIRRHLPATRAIKGLLDAGTLGQVRSVSWFEGGPFGWPVASPSYFSTEQSGGGVLQDIGTHALDLLAWWLGQPKLLDYSDDFMGGVEANSRLRLRCGEADVRMRLSRDWARPNRVTIRGERGMIGWDVNEPLQFTLQVSGAPSGLLTLDDTDGSVTDFVSAYAQQIRDVIVAVRTGGTPAVPGAMGRDVCALIEACYRNRRLLEMAWFSADEQARALAIASGPR